MIRKILQRDFRIASSPGSGWQRDYDRGIGLAGLENLEKRREWLAEREHYEREK